jgi:hypothetical protein
MPHQNFELLLQVMLLSKTLVKNFLRSKIDFINFPEGKWFSECSSKLIDAVGDTAAA